MNQDLKASLIATDSVSLIYNIDEFKKILSENLKVDITLSLDCTDTTLAVIYKQGKYLGTFKLIDVLNQNLGADSVIAVQEIDTDELLVTFKKDFLN